MSKRAKEARRQEDIARQKEEVTAIGNQFLAQLIPGSEEYNQFQSEALRLAQTSASPADEQTMVRELGQRMVAQQQARIAGGGPATAQEAATNLRIQGLREAAQPVPFEQDVLSALTGQPTTTPTGAVFGNVVNRAANPTIDDAVFKNALKLVEDRVNQEYAGRGLLGSGIRLEGLGRAGVEAAIAEAQRQDQLRQEALGNFRSLYGEGENLRNRGIGLEGDLVNLQLGRESNLTGLLNANTNTRITDTSNLLGRQTSRAQDFTDFWTTLDENDRRAFNQAVGTLGGPIIGGLVGGKQGATAGLNTVSSILASSIGLPSPVQNQSTVPNLLGAQRASQTSSGTPAMTPLTRQSSGGGIDLAALLKLLAVA